MKKLILLTAMLISCLELNAQQIKYPYSMPGPEGIYVMCGNEIPREISYSIYRMKNGDKDWEYLTTLSFNTNMRIDDFFKQLELINAKNSIYELPEETSKGNIWQWVKRTGNIDSIPFIGVIPMYREALGVCYYDRTAAKNTQYSYKIVKKSANGTPVESTIQTASYPPDKQVDYDIKATEATPNEKYVHVRFQIKDKQQLYTAKMYRQYYMQSEFVPLSASVGFSENNGIVEAWLIDTTTVKRAIMQYYLLPYDLYGNAGKPSDTIRVTNLIDKAETMIMGLHTKCDTANKTVQISWKCEVPEFLRSIDVYRSSDYDNGYQMIGSAVPHDTMFIDEHVDPITTYYYYLVINNAYGQSERSARIAGMLEASLQAAKPSILETETLPDGNIKLTWLKPSADTRGYYVMRNDDGGQEMRQVSGLIITDSAKVTYIDTLNRINQKNTSSVFGYAVKSENTSYNISDASDTVYVTPVLQINLAAPTHVEAFWNGSSVLVTWQNIDQLDKNVMAYGIMKRSISANKDTTQWQLLIDRCFNNYLDDTAIANGFTYEYAVISIGINDLQSDMTISNPAMIPLFRPVSISSLVVNEAKDGMQLNWEKTQQEDIVKYNVYRMEDGTKPVLLTTSPVNTTNYTDRTAKSGIGYVYAITCVNSSNIESNVEDWVSGFIDK